MSDNPEGNGTSTLQPSETFNIHKRVKDVAGSGKTDKATGRYIPVSGGSRTRIPMADDKRISRYAGNLGVDASLSAKIDSMAALYALLSPKTKQALGADFAQSIGRPEIAELPVEAEAAAVAPVADETPETSPMDAAPETEALEEAPQLEPEAEPPGPAAEEPATPRKIVPAGREWDDMII